MAQTSESVKMDTTGSGDAAAIQPCDTTSKRPRKTKSDDYSFTPKFLLPQESEEERLKALSIRSQIDLDTQNTVEMANVEEKSKSGETGRSRTENNAPAFNTTDDARLNFFFQVKEESPANLVTDLVSKSWSEAPLDTLKLIVHLRDIRTGKGVRMPFFHCLYWMYQHHPLTLYHNLNNFVDIGYWKDLNLLLLTVAFNGHVPDYLEYDDSPKTRPQKKKRPHPENEQEGEEEAKKVPKGNKGRFTEGHKFNDLVADHFKLSPKERATLTGRGWNELRIRFARDRFLNDPKYRAFHVKIAQLFAQQLQEDFGKLKNMKSDESEKKKVIYDISYAAKWAPSLLGHVDRYTLLATTIGFEVAKRRSDLDWILNRYPSTAACLARKHLHKEYYRPLRDATAVPEVHMHRDEWQLIQYERVPSKCMKKNKGLFLKHDEERFKQFIESSKKVAGAALKPVEIIAEMMTYVEFYETQAYPDSAESEEDETQNAEPQDAPKQDQSEETKVKIAVLEKQWVSLCEDIAKKGGGLLNGVVSICDVSGSMDGTPMQAAIALTLLACQLSNEPWSKVCITFSATPELWEIDPNASLFDKVKNLKSMKWGYNTNIQAVFDLILDMAKRNNLIQEDMPKLLAIFTDMEFDDAARNSSDTNFEAAKKAFEEAGYQLPPILFWNLRGAGGPRSCPVQKDERGTLLLSGYSGQLLARIMAAKSFEDLTPLTLMLEVIASKAYDKFKLYD